MDLVATKSRNRATTALMNDMLRFMHVHLLPQLPVDANGIANVQLPHDYNTVDSALKRLQPTFLQIHVCVRGCLLFRGRHKSDNACSVCGEMRFEEDTDEAIIRRKQIGEVLPPMTVDEKVKKCKPRRVMLYAPLIPRLRVLLAHPVFSHLFHYADKHMRNKDPNIVSDITQSELYHRFANKFPLYSEGQHGINY